MTHTINISSAELLIIIRALHNNLENPRDKIMANNLADKLSCECINIKIYKVKNEKEN